LDQQNNYVGRFKLVARTLKPFAVLSSMFKRFYIIILSLTKLFSDLYLAEFLDMH